MSHAVSVVPLAHLILRLRSSTVRSRVEQHFNSWLPSTGREELVGALEPFVETRPLCYFDRPAVDTCLALFEDDCARTARVLREHNSAVTHAILSLFRLGASGELETSLGIQTPSQIAEMERIWHPEYQRYIEHIHNNLVSVILGILGKANGKDYLGLTLANRIERLTALGYTTLAAGASATIRNAISHGDVRFGHAKAIYTATKDTEELTPREFASSLDQLADVSAAIVVSILLFICRNPQYASTKAATLLPLGVRYLLIRGATFYRGFTLESVSESTNGKELVLNLYGRSGSRSRMVHRYDGLSAASQALVHGGGGYDLIAVSIDCGGSVPTYSPYKVKEMKAAFAPGAPKQLLTAVVEKRRELLWYDASAIARKLYSLRCILHETWIDTKRGIVTKWSESGLDVLSSRYQLRFTEKQGNKSVEKLRRIQGHAVLAPTEHPDDILIAKIARHATRRLRRRLLRSQSLEGKAGLFARFPKYVWVMVHSEDGRMRELESRKLGDSKLLALSEWTHRKFREKPVLLKGISEIRKGWRVAVPRTRP